MIGATPESMRVVKGVLCRVVVELLEGAPPKGGPLPTTNSIYLARLSPQPQPQKNGIRFGRTALNILLRSAVGK